MEDIVVDTSGFDWSIVFWIVAILVAAIVLIVIILKLKRALTRPETMGLTREDLQKRWQMIRQTSQQGGVMGAKVAIMEADALLDSALKSIMMPGSTLGERLKVACYKYPKLRDVWWAHRLRNQLVHETTFQISEREAKRALDEFEKAYKILNFM